MSPEADVRALLAERYGEDMMATIDTAGQVGQRARFLATMQAVMNWFVDNPDVPTPRSVMFGADVSDPTVVTDLAAAEGWRAPYPHPNSGAVQTDVTIAHGDVWVALAVRAVRPEHEAREL